MKDAPEVKVELQEVRVVDLDKLRDAIEWLDAILEEVSQPDSDPQNTLAQLRVLRMKLGAV